MVFAALAAILASVGIFSVLTFMVQQRAREFSVRLAVGANASDLLRLVLGGGLKLTAIGVGDRRWPRRRHWCDRWGRCCSAYPRSIR